MSSTERGREAAGLLAIDLVQTLSDLAVLVLGQELGDRGRVQFTARHAESFGESVGGLEQVVRERDCC